ncbi:hypothetical protein [Rhizobium sp. GR12]|uniref:hypothetical protein n=1 Tax=Rhizobium sp. GR12 TaxID=3053925 RepID=UPI002FBED153
MTDNTKKIYSALVEGAQAGLTDKALYQHVVEECRKAASKKIVKASLLALSDPDLKDSGILHATYALAIKHRPDLSCMNDVEEPEAAKERQKKTNAPPKKPFEGQVPPLPSEG